MTGRFFQVVLRTSDVAGALAFYASVLGEVPIRALPLHEQAVARGAPPHWLGFIEVTDVSAAAAAFSARGASALGPQWKNPEGLEAAVMRDPGGAVVALAKPPQGYPTAPSPEIAWYLLNTQDVVRAKESYDALFGWEFGSPQQLGEHGEFHPFAWQRGGATVGGLSDIAERPGVHPHWLFNFRVARLEPALRAVRNGGGKVLGPFALPSGEQVAVCDDPQGAAFALRMPPSA